MTCCFQVDHFACGGIDQLTEKVPQLKDATPKLIEETKVNIIDQNKMEGSKRLNTFVFRVL